MKRVRNGATEPVMTEREMDRVTDRVTDRVMDLVERVTDRVMEPVRQEMQEIKHLIESRVTDRVMDLLDQVTDRVMEPVRQEMQEIKRLIENKQSAPADCNVNPRTSLDQVETLEGRGYRLLFANKLTSTIFTDSKIEVEIGGPVKIVLIDSISKETVTSGPLSSIKIQILVLDGDFGSEGQENWTEQDFNDKVVHERDGKRPLVTGELNIMLRDGVGIISDLSFTDNSSWIRCRKFRLGARVVQSIGGHVRIKEAISEAFVVKDHRIKMYGKHHPPSLVDKVWRLEKIRKDGKFHQRLASHQIDTVKDFMRMYVTNPTKLREMLDCPEGAWDKIVEHASTCAVADEEFYDYSVEGIGLLFNSIYMLVAAKFDGHNYQSLDKLSVVQKSSVESTKEQAYRNVSRFVPFDGRASVPSKSLPSLQDEPISGSTTGLQRPEFPVAEQGSAEMQIDCHHATTSSFNMGGLQLPVAQNTHLPQVIDHEIEMDGFFPLFNNEFVANLASEMASQAPTPTWSLVNATWEHNNGFNLPSTSNDSEFGQVANTHGMPQAVDSMSTRSPLSATWGNSNGMSMPIVSNTALHSEDLNDVDGWSQVETWRYYTRQNSSNSELAFPSNAHGMPQAVDPMSTRSPLRGNSDGMSMPIVSNTALHSEDLNDVDGWSLVDTRRYYSRLNSNNYGLAFPLNDVDGWSLLNTWLNSNNSELAFPSNDVDERSLVDTWLNSNNSELAFPSNTHSMQAFDPMSTRSPTGELEPCSLSGHNISLISNDYKYEVFLSFRNTHSMQAIDPMSTWYPLWSPRSFVTWCSFRSTRSFVRRATRGNNRESELNILNCSSIVIIYVYSEAARCRINRIQVPKDGAIL